MEHRMEIEECLEKILEHTVPTMKTEWVLLEECEGRICSEEITAKSMVPPFPKSAMDGYAVRAKDVEGATGEKPVELSVVGELFAGDYQEFSGRKNTAVRVMTGSYVPKGYDAVIRQEDTDYGEEQVAIYKGVAPFTNYCQVGEDIKKGDVVIKADTRLTPLHIGMLASLGIWRVKCYVPAKVAIISTGTELVKAGEKLPKGKIYSSISYFLVAAIRRQGLLVTECDLCPDEEAVLTKKLQQALKKADIILTTGAVSVGKKDIIPAVLNGMGAEILFSRANIQPGTPTIGSVLEGKVILSLSGNPFAAMANFEWYFWPVMAKWMHSDTFFAATDTVRLASPYPKINKARRMIRAYSDGREVTLPSTVHASSVLSNMVDCNCFIDLEPGRAVRTGDRVRIRYFKGSSR